MSAYITTAQFASALLWKRPDARLEKLTSKVYINDGDQTQTAS